MADHSSGVAQPLKPPPRIADLPLCTACRRAAEAGSGRSGMGLLRRAAGVALLGTAFELANQSFHRQKFFSCRRALASTHRAIGLAALVVQTGC